jgi:excisionase family DNA binding protein
VGRAAIMLGYDRSTIRRRIKAGNIPAHRLPGPKCEYRISLDWIEAVRAEVPR